MSEEELSLVFEGPLDPSAETLQRLQSVFSSELELPQRVFEQLLLSTPVTLLTSVSSAELGKYYDLLRGAGGRVLIVRPDSPQALSPKSLPALFPRVEVESSSERPETREAPALSAQSIPEFPKAIRIGEVDRNEYDGFLHGFPPFSDFSYTSLFCWDIADETRISRLNDNLVVELKDYQDQVPLVSFLGANDPLNTAKQLLGSARPRGFVDELRIVPEVSLDRELSAELIVKEDPDNADYVVSIADLASMSGPLLRHKRKRVNNFLEDSDGRHVSTAMDLNDPGVREACLDLFDRWQASKAHADEEVANERAALSRILNSAFRSKLDCFGVFVGDQLIAFTINELLTSPLDARYVMGHFEKTDNRFRGTLEFLVREVTQRWHALGYEYLNLEQDLGIPGLRTAKLSYRPVKMLKKYRIRSQ